MENWAAPPARYTLESDIKIYTPRLEVFLILWLVFTHGFTETKQIQSSAQGGLLSNSGVHGDQIGGDNVEDPRQRGASYFARLLQAGGVTMYVVLAECRRQGGSVSFFICSWAHALYTVIGLDVSLSVSPEEAWQKNKAQRGCISEPNFSSAPEVRETKIGAHPLLWRINFLKNSNRSTQELLRYLIGQLFIGFLDHCFQSGNSPISELHDDGTGLLFSFTEIPQEQEQLLGNLNLISIRTDNQILLKVWLKRDDCRHSASKLPLSYPLLGEKVYLGKLYSPSFEQQGNENWLSYQTLY